MEDNIEDLNTALFKAIENTDLAEVHFLLDKGADVNAKDDSGSPAVNYAVLLSTNEIAEMLINRGAEVNLKDEYGNTPLIYASDNDTKETAELLINKGADVNAKGDLGCTALLYASECGNLEIAELLLKKGADINAKDEDGKTALMFAADNQNDEIVELLINKGANVNAKDNDGFTALMYATDYGCKEIAGLLIKKGADIKAKDNKGISVLDLAKHNKYSGIVELLDNSKLKKQSISIMNQSNSIYKLINGEKGWITYFENTSGQWPIDIIYFISGCIFFLLAIPTLIYLNLPADFSDNYAAGNINLTELFISNLYFKCLIALIFILSFLLLIKKIITLLLDAKSESKFYRGTADLIKRSASNSKFFILKSGKLKWRVNIPVNIRMQVGDLIITEYRPYTPILIKLIVKHQKNKEI